MASVRSAREKAQCRNAESIDNAAKEIVFTVSLESQNKEVCYGRHLLRVFSSGPVSDRF